MSYDEPLKDKNVQEEMMDSWSSTMA
jgi:hypothetical protein